jgi:hypothetical protein
LEASKADEGERFSNLQEALTLTEMVVQISYDLVSDDEE